MKCSIWVALFALLLLNGAWAQQPDAADRTPLLSLRLTPQFTIPLGRDADIYSYGGGAEFAAEYRMPFLPLLFAGGVLGYSFVPLQADASISLVEGGITAGIRYDPISSLSLRAYGSGGYYVAFINDGTGRGAANPAVAGGVDVSWVLTPVLGLSLGATYRNCIGLYNDLAVVLGMTYGVSFLGGQSAEKGLLIKDLSLANVFPLLHAYYDTNSVGTLVLKNTEDYPVKDVTVSFIVRQFMDAPKDCAAITEMAPGEERRVDLFALFKNTIFETKQSTKVPAEISIRYMLGGKKQTTDKVETLRVYDRNALSWDDTNKAAAFIMPKEPAVLMLSNQINSFVKSGMNKALDRNMQAAIAFHDALRLLGIAYVSPPLTSYEVRSQNKTAIDSVKFPLETIQYRSADCSDLSILYCSLLESVQIETAFITIPGHIFIAFALSSSEEAVRKYFTHTDDLIFMDGKAWVPVEVTDREGLFMSAWRTGAQEWREGREKNQAEFFPVRKAWDTYEPVNYPGIGSQPSLPDNAQVARDFQSDVQALITREIMPRETELMAAVSTGKGSPKAANALGAFYARYDLAAKAEAQFQDALRAGDYIPALVNLGNLRFRDGRFEDALAFYQRAFAHAPHEPLVLLGCARCNQQLKNYGMAKTEYEELRQIRPELASQYAYLQVQNEESTRKAEASEIWSVVEWMEE